MPFKIKRRRYLRPRKGARPRVTKKGVKRAISEYKGKVFDMAVKRAMAGQMELKQLVEQAQFSPLPFDGATNQATIDLTNGIPFDPNITHGTGPSGRIGNRIMMKSVKFSYSFCPNPQNVSGVAIPTIVRMVFYYDRQDPLSLPTPYTNANFFDLNNASQQFTGTYTDMVRTFNTDRYRICKVRTLKVGFANNQGSSGSGTNQYFANNDFKLNHRGTIDLTKYIIKNQKFNDNLGFSQNRKLYCLVYITITNSAVFGASNLPVNMTHQTVYKWTDA